ncbi:hypothetical protein [Streptomyces sp. NPDC085932]|uniref:hypothetical protein n=1 Tax=Streptomyces sp. NPDC085932 TaxID=3365741 RepID=UPI0037D3D714
MPRHSRKPFSPTNPLVRKPVRIGKITAAAAVAELRQLHEAAEDPYVERMPAPDEVYSSLLYAERHAEALRVLPLERRKAAALIRIRLWEYLRERADVHQARAVADARVMRTEWAELAPALAVKAPSAAYNKAKRLLAAALADASPDAPPVRRTPEAVVEVERRITRQREADERAAEAARKQHHLLVPVAQRLLENRPGLVLDEDAEYWLDELAEVLPNCSTPTQMLGLARYLSAAVRALTKLERNRAQPVARTDEARLALSAAADIAPH